ncbi:Tetratricopeptide repeat (TPR)-like superfamily protein [Striga hermonthica]|uniref:Tetratricopeptide repeat (TPR)-like superfamily protein n=1 Tax=Striga hermonthica TaxID=68872 RepID=A0A9N7MXR5_STRHE|nr:Tetratricopeptide repeat (TPR)-like superfamily protein [Striga hermonthica]
MLHTEPSFAIYSTDDKFAEGAENEDLIREKIERSDAIGKTIDTQFSFESNSMRIIEEDDDDGEENERVFQGLDEWDFDRDGDLDSYFSKLVEKDPSNPLVLRNYAQYLESRRDFSGAEGYYYRAMLVDPKDGEMLSQYAKLVWEIHGDQAKASHYFKRAVQAAPENSNVLAAYASFMWNIDDESDEEERWPSNQVDEYSKEVKRPSSPPLHLAVGLGLDGQNIDCIDTCSDESSNVEEYYKRMTEENPHNLSSLRGYAIFLHQSRGNLSGAEEYCSRAIIEDPNDGQMLCLYANILWQLHGDKDRAMAHFERAVLASPGDSNVLAAYAKFLWETDAEEI